LKTEKEKLMIVGAFPSSNNTVYGGILKSCELIIESPHFSTFKILKFDSSQISNPPPNIIIRGILAMIRLLKFVYSLVLLKPKTVLIFCSDGSSAIEKGVMILICKLLEVKSIIFPRAGNIINQVEKFKFFHFFIKYSFRKATLFLCQGSDIMNFSKDKLNIDTEKVKIISNWTATDELIRIGENRTFNRQTKCIKILYVGWLEKQKGIIELLEVVNNLHLKKYKIHLLLVGDGSLRNHINGFINKNNLFKVIDVSGWLVSDEINIHLKKSDIFVLPSWQEGMPNALIEAISAALPSIVTSVGVIPNYLTHNESTLFIKPKSNIQLEAAIEKLINNLELRKKLSKNGHLISKNIFSTSKSLKKLSSIIKQIEN
jgi:glycosyltransferase involved in cell wall biosynthesis